jgi:AraC family transcriptional regulator of adaptative response / DNA-3-methyladenine glycosylase II
MRHGRHSHSPRRSNDQRSGHVFDSVSRNHRVVLLVPPYDALDAAVLSRACDARDVRFDGLFFVAITTTGIYCRPTCPARVSYPERRRFFSSAAAAEEAGYRPCLRCRPELAPGRAEMEVVGRLASRAARRIAAGALNGHTVADLANEFGVSERHLRRALERELGVSPLQLALTHRLLLAKQLLADTSLPVTRVAYASGFQSLRRFNAVFQERYRMPPNALRRRRNDRARTSADPEMLRLTLSYRPPFNWNALLHCLTRDAIQGVDFVDGPRYARSVEIGGRRGVIVVENDAVSSHLNVHVSLSLVPVLMPLLVRLRQMLDLDAEPAVIDEHLAAHGLRQLIALRPGVRIPGAFGGFESALRALIGGWPAADASARSAARRVVEAIGRPNEAAPPHVGRILPDAGDVAAAGPSRLENLGVPLERATILVALARRIVDGALRLDACRDAEVIRHELLAVDGVDTALADLIVMRALSWPNAFPFASRGSCDVTVARRDRSLMDRAHRWRPWAAYAFVHLWLDGVGAA